MVISIQPPEFARLYRRAKESCRACMNKPDSAFLQAEAPLPLRDIEVREEQVKLVFSAGSVALDQVEVHLRLYANGQWMGDYVAFLDAAGELIDDSLVFH